MGALKVVLLQINGNSYLAEDAYNWRYGNHFSFEN
jgi:hypothetical protein